MRFVYARNLCRRVTTPPAKHVRNPLTVARRGLSCFANSTSTPTLYCARSRTDDDNDRNQNINTTIILYYCCSNHRKLVFFFLYIIVICYSQPKKVFISNFFILIIIILHHALFVIDVRVNSMSFFII